MLFGCVAGLSWILGFGWLFGRVGCFRLFYCWLMLWLLCGLIVVGWGLMGGLFALFLLVVGGYVWCCFVVFMIILLVVGF